MSRPYRIRQTPQPQPQHEEEVYEPPEPKHFGYQDASSLEKTEFGARRQSAYNPYQLTREEQDWFEIKKDPRFIKLDQDLNDTFQRCRTLEDFSRTKALTWIEFFNTFPGFFNTKRYNRIKNYFKQQNVHQWELSPQFRPQGYVHEDRYTPFMTYLIQNIPRFIQRHIPKNWL